jgi:hypothetical protein
MRTETHKNDDNAGCGVERQKMLYVPEKAIEWGGSGDANKILKMRQGKSFRKLDLLSAATAQLTRHPAIMEDQREWRYNADCEATYL